MASIFTLGDRFREADRPFHSANIAKYWVLKTVADDAVRSVQLYKHLREISGPYAADLFERHLENYKHSPENYYIKNVKNKKKITIP